MSQKTSKTQSQIETCEKSKMLVSHLLDGKGGTKSHLSKKLGVCRKTVNKHLSTLVEKKIVVCTKFGDDKFTYSLSREYHDSSVKSIINLMKSC
ncbi:hypothetical protein GW931_03750 [archaeon]|nr:hypothetical protein [archaeon]PJC45692.1 MAG: hypothetical protein CO037_00170 [Candidatus Pacearchaeota archaeon CG_4_9_14_0_2_um_filter_30_8]